MSKADILYKEIVEDIIENGYSNEGENVRARWADGTPAYTKSVIGRTMRFDNTEVPILTQKRVAWKTAIKELLWIWQKQSNDVQELIDNNVNIWNEWRDEKGTIGRSYGSQFESHKFRNDRSVITVKQIKSTKKDDIKNIKLINAFERNEHCKDPLMDKVFKSNRCGYAKVIDVLPSNTVYEKTVAIRLQFIDTGYITTIQKNDLLRGRFVDRFARTVCNVGYLGAYENVKSFNEEELKYFRGTWNSMISRCYNPNNKNYDRYGGKGIFVDERWHCFEYYLSDISSLPQFHLAKNEKYKNWAIDKDYYISNYYSNSSCVWLPYSENTIYNSNHSPFYVISKDGDKELFIEQKKACQKYNFDNSNLSKAIRFNKTLKGFRFETVSDGNTYRYELSRNQVTELIYNIKHSPASRRLMTSFWNYADVNKKQLQECVWSTQWHVKAGKLHLEVLCRSNDVFLGNPFNVFQYNVLQRMIAQVTGYELGEYIFHIGDTHVYDRHIDIIKQQIESTMYDAPQLWINPNITDFYKFTADDFKLIDYKHGETLRMEVAI